MARHALQRRYFRYVTSTVKQAASIVVPILRRDGKLYRFGCCLFSDHKAELLQPPMEAAIVVGSTGGVSASESGIISFEVCLHVGVVWSIVYRIATSNLGATMHTKLSPPPPPHL